MTIKGKRVLHIITENISVLDIPSVLDELGYKVYTANLKTHSSGFYMQESQEIMQAIEEHDIDYVTSYDFSESISYACMKQGVPYISWVFDDPQKELYSYYAFYPCNYIFVFDKVQERRLKEIGLKNVYFMPLAIHGEKIQLELKMCEATSLCDIAFVGQTYYVDNVEKVVENSPKQINREVHKYIDKYFMNWEEGNCIHGTMSEECAMYFDSVEAVPIETRYPYIKKEFYYETAVLSRMLAYRERIHILNTLAERYDVRFYTFDKHTDELSDKVKVYPGIKYDGGISCVYRDAKININNTLHCIETGACQRVFEVMAAGGFLISNYQKELEELFVPGKEIVLYRNEEELLQLVEYYLTHDEERREIARNGQRKVLSNHTLRLRFQKIMPIVYAKEKHRKESYLSIQRKELTEVANQAFKNGSKEEINALFDLYYNPVYDLTISGNNSLTCVYHMLFVWRLEQRLQGDNIFEGIQDVSEAEIRYLRTRHILWRIENNCSYDACYEGVRELIEKKISVTFMAWQINNVLSEQRNMYLKLSEYLWEFSPSKAVELVAYGLSYFPGDTEMLMYKANYLLESQCYKEALETLKCITNPSKEIISLIEELEEALGMK